MQIQSIKLISNVICYGPKPFPEDEVEQRLTVSATGRVWFTGYNYATGNNYAIGRKQQFSIGKAATADILSLFSQYFGENTLDVFVTDIGSWDLMITDTENNKYEFNGPLCGDIVVDGIDLNDYIQKHIPVNNLFAFGG